MRAILALLLGGVVALAALARAATTRPVLKLDQVALEQVLEFLGESANVNVHVNWAALRAAGVEPSTPVSLELGSLPIRKVLSLVLSGLGGTQPITFYVDQGVLEITSQSVADQRLITRAYPVDDLLLEIPDFQGPDLDMRAGGSGTGGRDGGGSAGGLLSETRRDARRTIVTRQDRAQELVDLITQSIRPEIWRSNGGTASIRYFRGLLIVTAPSSVHEGLAGGRR